MLETERSQRPREGQHHELDKAAHDALPQFNVSNMIIFLRRYTLDKASFDHSEPAEGVGMDIGSVD
jgi:hypothetical protein